MLAFTRSRPRREVVTGPYREVLIDGAGHWLQQERPDEVNAALLDFLEQDWSCDERAHCVSASSSRRFIRPANPQRWHWNTTWSASSRWTGSGFDEAWFGEHHSGGYELIACPEVFIAAAAERTKHIRLGTGVVSLPYHHPLMVADRWVLLDHLTRGRVMFGTGPGALPSDAYMMGIDPIEQRRMMQESLEAILALFRAGPERAHRPSLGLVHPARRAIAYPPLHLAISRNLHGGNDFAVRTAAGRRSGHIAAVAVDVGARRLRGAGKHLAGGAASRPPRSAATSPTGPTGGCCSIMHIADTRDQAIDDCTYGLQDFANYFGAAGFVPLANEVEGAQSPYEFVEDYAAKGQLLHRHPRRRDRPHRRPAGAIGRFRDVADARPRLGVTRRRLTIPMTCSPAR